MKYLENFYHIMNKDWKQIILDWWNNISPISKKSFLWIFSIVNLVFLWHTITFFFGNHDWEQIKSGLDIGWSIWDGRWGAGLIQQITGGDILPVWNNLFCFAGFSLATIYLAKYWELPKNVFIYTIFGLFIILMPYTNPWLQFVRSETHFWNVFLIIFALYICSFKKLWAYCFAGLLLIFCLGCYAAMIQTIFVIFFGRLVLDVWFDNKTLHQIIKDRWKTIVVIILSVLLFIIIWEINRRQPYFFPWLSTVKTVDIYKLLNNLMNFHKGIITSFFTTMPYIPKMFKFLLGLSIPIVLFLMLRFTKKQIVTLCLLFFGILISTQLTNLLSVEDHSLLMRINFWAIPYTYALFWAILLKSGKWKENIAILFMCVSIYYMGLQDIRDQKVKYFDKLRDTRIFDNVIARIKANPRFNPKKEYKLLVVGNVSDLEKPSTFDKYNSNINWANAWIPLIPDWNAEEYINFYEKNPFIIINYTKYKHPLEDNDLKNMDLKYLLEDAKAYPNLKSTYVDDDHIYIIFQESALSKLKARIKNLK